MTLVNPETVEKVVKLVGGDDAVKIVNVLLEVDEIIDDEIVNKTELRLNIVRKILYKLYEHSIVGLRRTRDKNTGWFVFHWRLQPDQIDGFIINQKRNVLKKLKERLEYEEKHDFFYCNTPECKKLPFEEATEYVFRCPQCGNMMSHSDNQEIKESLSEKINKIMSELGDETSFVT